MKNAAVFGIMMEQLQRHYEPGLPITPTDFGVSSAPSEQLLRPKSANTQCGYVLKELIAGRRVSSMSIISGGNIVKPTNRISEVRRTLRSHGITLRHEVVKANGKRFYSYFLDGADQARAAGLLKPAQPKPECSCLDCLGECTA
ncbi:hypothetical protein [Ancylobacter sp.]|uniref:hypothetical protein n=1 Tax=Ancylobacter sp. TaxID=1872567 RepID=UPI003C79830F